MPTWPRPFALLPLRPGIREGSGLPRCTNHRMLRFIYPICILPKRYYGIESTFLQLALIVLACIPSTSQLRCAATDQWIAAQPDTEMFSTLLHVYRGVRNPLQWHYLALQQLCLCAR